MAQDDRCLGYVDLESGGQITRLRPGRVYALEMENCGMPDALQATEECMRRLDAWGLVPLPMLIVVPKGCTPQEQDEIAVQAIRWRLEHEAKTGIPLLLGKDVPDEDGPGGGRVP